MTLTLKSSQVVLTEKKKKGLTLRRSNDHGVHEPVVSYLAHKVKVGSDHSENFTKLFDGAKNGYFNKKLPNIFESCLKVRFFNLIFTEKKCALLWSGA